MTKKCTICKQILNIDCFYKNKRLKNGLTSECKKCISNRSKGYYVKNKDSIIKRVKEYGEKNPDVHKRANAKYRKTERGTELNRGF